MWACVQNSKMRVVSEERQNSNITFLRSRLSALLTFAFFLLLFSFQMMSSGCDPRLRIFFFLPNCVVNEPLDPWLCMISPYLVLYYGLSDWRGWFYFKTGRPGCTGHHCDTAKSCLESYLIFRFRSNSINMLHTSTHCAFQCRDSTVNRDTEKELAGGSQNHIS